MYKARDMWKWRGPIISAVVVFLVARWWWKEGDTTETFHGKNVVICGGSTGIGKELAYRYSEQGANVILVARREDMLKKVAKNCSSAGALSAAYVTADLSTIEGAKRVHEEAVERFGTIDVLVLNHVIYDVQRWHGDRDLSEVTKFFDTNVISYINLATLFLSNLEASRGRLVVVSSGLGVFTYPYFALYCANKHALHGFFDSLRQDIALNNTGEETMSITMILLGAIATENALEVATDNPVAGEKGWTRFSAVDASHAMLKASLYRERQMYFPSPLLTLHHLVSFHFPSLTEKFIRYIYGLNA